MLICTGCNKPEKPAGESRTIKFGTLSVLQSLPLFVADEKDFFDQAGLEVELIPFLTAAEKDIAMKARAIDGYFGDLFTPVVLENNGVDISIVASCYSTQKDRRMFAILTKPGGGYLSAEDLAGIPVAASSNTVIHYVIEKLLTANGVTADKIELLESKNIGLRFQMLTTGQVEAAALPEPLISAAAAQGAGIIADDAGLSTSQTVLIFSEDFIKRNPGTVKRFLRAVETASKYIAANPDSARSAMVEYARLPEPMMTKYPIPKFPELFLPEVGDMTEVIVWLTEKGVVNQKLTYENLVNDSFLP